MYNENEWRLKLAAIAMLDGDAHVSLDELEGGCSRYVLHTKIKIGGFANNDQLSDPGELVAIGEYPQDAIMNWWETYIKNLDLYLYIIAPDNKTYMPNDLEWVEIDNDRIANMLDARMRYNEVSIKQKPYIVRDFSYVRPEIPLNTWSAILKAREQRAELEVQSLSKVESAKIMNKFDKVTIGDILRYLSIDRFIAFIFGYFRSHRNKTH